MAYLELSTLRVPKSSQKKNMSAKFQKIFFLALSYIEFIDQRANNVDPDEMAQFEALWIHTVCKLTCFQIWLLVRRVLPVCLRVL